MRDPLADIAQYSPRMTIAQVLKFCEKKNLSLTRAMIQNYIRDGLLPPPIGRIYTHKHLAALVMIDYLKTVFDLPDIKTVLVPLMDDDGLPLTVYTRLIQKSIAMLEKWQEHVVPVIENDEDAMLLVMTHAAGIKALVREL